MPAMSILCLATSCHCLLSLLSLLIARYASLVTSKGLGTSCIHHDSIHSLSLTQSHSPATSRDSDRGESSTSPPSDDRKRQAHDAGHTPPDEQYYMSERLIENSFQECCCVGVTGLFLVPIAIQPPIKGIFPSLTINHGW